MLRQGGRAASRRHGPTLAEVLAARVTPAEDLARWVGVFEQICAPVAFAHARA